VRKWVLILLILAVLSGFYLAANYSGYGPGVDRYSYSLLDYLKSNSWQIKRFLEDNGIVTSVKTTDKKQILLAIFAGSITILAIVFSVSHFTISHISTNYSPYILEKYRKSFKFIATFFIFLFLVLISLISATFANLNLLIYLAILILFVFGLILVSAHFKFVLTLLDPNKVLKLLQEDIRKSISKGRTNEFADYMTSMGDIATKSLVRKEESITQEYVNGFYEIFRDYLLMLNSKDEKLKRNLGEFRSDDLVIGGYLFLGEKEDIVSIHTANHLERVFLTGIQNEEKKVTTEIASKLFHIVLDILKEGDDVVFRQWIDTKGVKGAIYYQFFKNAIEHKDVSRQKLVSNLFSILQSQLIFNDNLNRYKLNQLIDYLLFRVNKLILDHNDLELFWYEMLWASQMINFSIYFPIRILNDIIELLHEMIEHDNKLHTPEIISRIDECSKHELFKNFNTDKFGQSLTTLKKQLQEYVKSEDEKEGIEEKFKNIEKSLEEYETIVRLFRTFFLLGAYLLFLRGQNEKFDHTRYIKELWEHTSPEDADAHHINKTPVCFDPIWLIYLITYGGENSIIWFVRYDREFKGYHGIRDYIYQYWILLMGKWKEELDIPDENKIISWKNSGYEFKLEFWAELCRDFLNCHKENIQKNFDKILENKLYKDIYKEEDMRELKNKFEDLVKKMEKALESIQKAQP